MKQSDRLIVSRAVEQALDRVELPRAMRRAIAAEAREILKSKSRIRAAALKPMDQLTRAEATALRAGSIIAGYADKLAAREAVQS